MTVRKINASRATANRSRAIRAIKKAGGYSYATAEQYYFVLRGLK